MANNNYRMFAGDTKTLEMSVIDDDGLIVDISDAKIRWMMARSVNSKTTILSKGNEDSPPEIEIVLANHGRFNVYLGQDDTETLRGDYYHEAEVVLPDGTIGTPISGTITIDHTLIPAVSGA
jgi:hypothetical protein